MNDWQPAIIASHEHVARLHKDEPRAVTQYAGVKIRVRENEAARSALDKLMADMIGCKGHSLEVHPEDAEKLWPACRENGCNVSICTCSVLTD